MKTYIYVDEHGYNHRALAQSQELVKQGISQDPPDINLLDWESIKRDLHNELLKRRVINYSDIQAGQHILSSIVKTVIVKRLVKLYRGVE